MSDAAHNEELIIRYLLGELPEPEVERFDELSVTDDEFSHQVQAVENDLIDAYARGELAGPAREQFQRRLLVTPRQRERVDFARSLAQLTASEAAFGTAAGASAAAVSWWQSLLSAVRSRLSFQIAFAAVVLIGLLLSTLLLVERARLQKQMQEERAALVREKQILEERIAKQDGERTQPTPVEQAPPPKSKLAFLAFKPSLSGTGERKQLTLLPSTEAVQVRLEFESDDYPSYRVELRSLADGQQVWEKGKLKARAKGGSKIIDLLLPATRFKPQAYQLDLKGITAGGAPEDLSSYSFSVVKKSSINSQ